MFEKEEIYSSLTRLEAKLRQELSEKQKITEDIKQNSNIEPEGLFVKKWLQKNLHEEFGESLYVEGMNSEGKTQFKHIFFGANPAPDFVVREPYHIVGEVKYCKLSTRAVGTAIGQAIVYLASSKAETPSYTYGCIIFFDTSLRFKEYNEEEYKLIQDLWNKENVFLIIM